MKGARRRSGFGGVVDKGRTEEIGIWWSVGLEARGGDRDLVGWWLKGARRRSGFAAYGFKSSLT